MRFQKTICALLVAATFSGCASVVPKDRSYPEASPITAGEAAARMSSSWGDLPAQREGKASIVLITPFAIPKEVRSKQIRLELESGATVKDLVAVMGNLGYSIILADKDAGEKQFYMPKFSGSLGKLLSAVSRATDIWFTWNDGTIVVSGKEKISVTVPQEEALGTKISEGLKALGIESAASSWEAGMVSLELTPTQLARVKAYLQRMTSNAALVSLQVAIINVQMSQDAKQGIDWTKLQLAAGTHFAGSNLLDMTGFKPTQGTTTGTTAGTGTTTGTTTGTPSSTTTGTVTAAAAVIDQAISAVALTAGGMKGLITNQLFSFTGLYDFLQTYGTTETTQNVVLKTIAGTQVELKSLTQTPYVESIAVTTTAGGTGATGSALGSAKTAKADDGLTLTMTPTFDAAANTVTVKMDLSLKAVLGFSTLSAGAQLGTLSQPTTAERAFNDVLRLRPGQTVVVGGITYDSVGSEGNAPNAMSPESKWSHKTLKVNRNSMFIVVRPTVVSLGQVTEEEGSELLTDGAAETAILKKPARPAKPTKPTRSIEVAAPEAKAAAAPVKPVYNTDGYTSVPLRGKD